MKRFLCLLPAFLLLVWAVPAEAILSDDCKMLLELEPISSDYVKEVLKRADAGIASAKKSAADTEFSKTAVSWARSISTAWAEMLDTDVQVSDQSQSLNTESACLQFDTQILHCKIAEVRDELRAQFEIGSWLGIVQLQDLLLFLNKRLEQLRIGALDGLYKDPLWDHQFNFDSPSSDTPETPRAMCPFNTDYAPAFLNGFGCDLDAMEGRWDKYTPMKAEYQSLEVLMDQVDIYRKTAQEFLSVQQDIDQLFGNESTLPEPPPERKHINAFGCVGQGFCADDETKRCFEDMDCGKNVTCDIPKTVCDTNRAQRCKTDQQCGEGGKCIQEEPIDALHELRGPFSLGKNQLSILSDFLGVRTAQELSRTFSSELKFAEEFEEGEEKDSRKYEDDFAPFRWGRADTREQVRVLGQQIARTEASIYPEAIDSGLEVANALTSLRAAVSNLARLASQREDSSDPDSKPGVRDFVIRYAYFLRRTCVHRPCNLILDQAIKIALANACFPYTNGEYLGDTEDDPRWQKCKQAAGITE